MKLDHVAIQVNNLEECVDWYVNNFSADISYKDDTWAMLRIGTTNLALTLPSQHPAHIAFEVDTLDDFPEGEIKYHRDGSAYLYESDP